MKTVPINKPHFYYSHGKWVGCVRIKRSFFPIDGMTFHADGYTVYEAWLELAGRIRDEENVVIKRGLLDKYTEGGQWK
jgi:hypothetical protein